MNVGYFGELERNPEKKGEILSDSYDRFDEVLKLLPIDLQDAEWYSSKFHFYNGFISGLRRSELDNEEITYACTKELCKLGVDFGLMRGCLTAALKKSDNLREEYQENFSILLSALDDASKLQQIKSLEHRLEN